MADQKAELISVQKLNWTDLYSKQERKEIWALARHVLTFAENDPGCRILAVTCTFRPAAFGDWDAVDPLAPSHPRQSAHRKLWKAYRQFSCRLTRQHVNHPEKHPEKWPFALAFVDDPIAKFGSHSGKLKFPHIHSILIIRSGLASSMTSPALNESIRECWSKSHPSAGDIHIKPIPNDLNKIAGWTAYSAKYAWRLRRLKTDDHEWDMFGRQLDPVGPKATSPDKVAIRHVIIVSPARRRNKRAHPDVFDVRIEGQERIICSSKQPFLDAARAMLNEGLATPQDRLVMRHAGSDTDCLLATAAQAAKLSVEERHNGRGPIFVRWKPFITADLEAARNELSRMDAAE